MRRGRFRIAAVLIVATALGCGSRARDFTPSLNVAESAMRKALDTWQEGEPVGEIPQSKPAIHVVDVGRKPGQTLAGYRILGETHGPPGRTFVVSLDLKNPDETLKVKYIVVGIDPLWVFRQEDYELLSHWDHHMPADTPNEFSDPSPAAEK